MKQDYHDILSRLGQPIWWDEAGCPRYTNFDPSLANDFYANEVALLRITCQHCAHEFVVCVSSGLRDPRPFSNRASPLTYGDPPRHCCQIGASMTSETVAILGIWSHENGKWVTASSKTIKPIQSKRMTPKAMFDRSVKLRKKLARAEGGSLSAGQAARLLGLTKATLLRRWRQHRIIGWKDGEEVGFPRWQFDQNKMLPGIREILNTFQSDDPWRVLLYFLSPRSSLADQRPLDLLRNGEIDRALRHARANLEGNVW